MSLFERFEGDSQALAFKSFFESQSPAFSSAALFYEFLQVNINLECQELGFWGLWVVTARPRKLKIELLWCDKKKQRHTFFLFCFVFSPERWQGGGCRDWWRGRGVSLLDMMRGHKCEERWVEGLNEAVKMQRRRRHLRETALYLHLRHDSLSIKLFPSSSPPGAYGSRGVC